jgi:hypothetical protein
MWRRLSIRYTRVTGVGGRYRVIRNLMVYKAIIVALTKQALLSIIVFIFFMVL